MCQALTKCQRKIPFERYGEDMITSYNKTGDFFTLPRASVSRLRGIRQKHKTEMERVFRCLWTGSLFGEKIARKGKFPVRLKACSKASYFVSREEWVARQFLEGAFPSHSTASDFNPLFLSCFFTFAATQAWIHWPNIQKGRRTTGAMNAEVDRDEFICNIRA